MVSLAVDLISYFFRLAVAEMQPLNVVLGPSPAGRTGEHLRGGASHLTNS
jgi:hypothetical protein